MRRKVNSKDAGGQDRDKDRRESMPWSAGHHQERELEWCCWVTMDGDANRQE